MAKRATRTPKIPASIPRRAFVVLGMHRSGTSAMSRILSLAGATLPARLMPGNSGNMTGYWEPQGVADFNDALFERLGSRWDDPFGQRGIATPPEFDALATQAATILAEDYRAAPLIVLKDPRISRLYDVWSAALARSAIVPFPIIMVRHPEAVAQSLFKRDGMDGSTARLLWATYMIAAEQATRGHPRLYVQYADLLADPAGVVARIADACPSSLPPMDDAAAKAIAAFIDPALDHHSGDMSGDPLEPVARLHDWFCDADEADAGPPEDITHWLDDLGRIVSPMLAHAHMAREADRTRAAAFEQELAALHIARSREDEGHRAYGRSLEQAIVDTQVYSRALETALGEAHAYARSLEATLDDVRTYCARLEQRGAHTGGSPDD